MSLAFQSVGIIYGDIGTSPLYVFSSTFTDGIDNTEDLLGCLSLIIYTIALLPFLKYIFIVLWANDNGDGTFTCKICMIMPVFLSLLSLLFFDLFSNLFNENVWTIEMQYLVIFYLLTSV